MFSVQTYTKTACNLQHDCTTIMDLRDSFNSPLSPFFLYFCTIAQTQASRVCKLFSYVIKTYELFVILSTFYMGRL